ncbi:MAG: cell wall-binding repeat-containing protein [Lachnospiraceae bacterium]|nr:cell wall-binding repeat-containing protein [Candidatus Equihabitans merdae]
MKKRLFTAFLAAVMMITVTATTVMAGPKKPFILRMEGASRYETSTAAADALITRRWGEECEGIVLATGAAFPDALTGAYLSRLYVDCVPLLLVDPGNINATVDLCDKKVSPNTLVYIIGGTSALPSSLDNILKARGYSVKRIAGNDRWDTNMQILQEATDRGVYMDQLLVTTGTDYPDALSASGTGSPIMLVSNSGLTSAQIQFLTTYKIRFRDIIILGGEKAVPTAVENQIRSLLRSDAKFVRLAGADRYETSYKVAEYFWGPQGRFSPDGITLVTGSNFPDGLSAGPFAYRTDAPIILVNNSDDGYKWAKKWVDEEITDYYDVNVLGGEAAVPGSLVKTIVGVEG